MGSGVSVHLQGRFLGLCLSPGLRKAGQRDRGSMAAFASFMAWTNLGERIERIERIAEGYGDGGISEWRARPSHAMGPWEATRIAASQGQMGFRLQV